MALLRVGGIRGPGLKPYSARTARVRSSISRRQWCIKAGGVVADSGHQALAEFCNSKNRQDADARSTNLAAGKPNVVGCWLCPDETLSRQE